MGKKEVAARTRWNAAAAERLRLWRGFAPTREWLTQFRSASAELDLARFELWNGEPPPTMPIIEKLDAMIEDRIKREILDA